MFMESAGYNFCYTIIVHLFISSVPKGCYNSNCLCRNKFYAKGIFKSISSSSQSNKNNSSSEKVVRERTFVNNNNLNQLKKLIKMTYYFTKVISLQFALCCAVSQGYVIDNSSSAGKK